MYKTFFKRILDITISLVVLLVLSPIFFIFGLIIFLQDFHSPFYSQNRVGKNLKIFKLFKLRSMKIGSDKQGYSTKSNDNRITPIGHFIRKTSIDELPQLFNVIIGDMSLVGPRPDVPAQIEQYDSREIWEKRHAEKPGITGLAQVTIRSAGTMKERTALDLKYFKEISLKSDIQILFKTLFKVLKLSQSN